MLNKDTWGIKSRAVRYHLKVAYHNTIHRVSLYTLGINTSHDITYMRQTTRLMCIQNFVFYNLVNDIANLNLLEVMGNKF